MAYRYWGHDGVTSAVVDCITRDGIHEVSIEVVARELRRSRSALYERYRNWRGLLTAVHDDLLKVYNAAVDHWLTDRRVVFDRWWNAMAHELRAPRGVAFRALRGLVADRGGCEVLAVEEVSQMRALIRFVDEAEGLHAGLVALRMWLLLLGSTPFKPGSTTELGFRALAWELLERHGASRTDVLPSG